MASIFFTGFPGFLGAELLPRLLGRASELRAICLVQSKFAALAQQRVEAIVAAHPQLAGRIELVEGDITTRLYAPGRDVFEIYHLAAVYDLMVPREMGMRVNVEGTANVLDFAQRCPSLHRFHYVSTCYVSGRYDGVFNENDLQKGQTFNNYYEETKYLAEVEVQKRMRAGLPGTIYRPAVVVGDSATGATQKFDGPYFVMQWLLRQPRLAVMPVVGNPRKYTFNVVPRDFIVRAIEHLSAMSESRGKVYQLADPNPMTVEEILRSVAAATGRRLIRIPLPLSVAKASLDYVPGVYKLMRIPSAAVDYFVHPTTYGTANAERDLAGAGMTLPRFADYLPQLVGFVRAHPEIGSAAMA